MFKKIFKKMFRTPVQQPKPTSFRAREIWWCSFDGSEGPVLVFRRFGTGALWGLPLSARGTGTEAPLYMLAPLHGKNQALLSRMRTLQTEQLIRRVGMMSMRQFAVLNGQVVSLLQESDPSRVRMTVRTHRVRSANPRTLLRPANQYSHVSKFLPTLTLKTR